MGKQSRSIESNHREFILQQHIFFTASAAAEGRVNVSPKDGASLRILSANSVAYLDLTGSGNETAAHLRANGRLTSSSRRIEWAPASAAAAPGRTVEPNTVSDRGSRPWREIA